jgi:CRISPR/Cas system-associated exonuclease Cas4 (RecB family)
MGNRVHEALKKLYSDVQMTRIPTLSELLEHYERAWLRRWNSRIKIPNPNYREEDYFNLGKSCLTKYYNRYHPFDGGITLGLEEQVEFNLDEEGKYKIVGFIDRLVKKKDGVYAIHDYKTARYLPTQASLDKDRQLTLYQIAIQERFKDVVEVHLVWHYLVFDLEMRSTRSREELEAVRMETLSLIESIEAEGNFHPREGLYCRWCDYKKICPAKKHELETSTLPADEFLKDSGVKLVNEYVQLLAERKRVEEKIKGVREAIVRKARDEGLTRLVGSTHYVSLGVEDENFTLRVGEFKESEF